MRLNSNDFDINEPEAAGPCTITIHYDSDGSNPWESWDCQTPLAWRSLGRRSTTHVHDEGDGILDPFGGVSPAWVSRHWRALCDALDLEQESETLEAEAQARDYGDALGTVRLERFRETLDDMAGDSWGTTVDYFDAVAAVWALRKIPVLTFQRNGYSQGDSVVGLLVATPAHAARCGFDLANPGHDIAESLEGDANLFGAWAFGDVYGFDIQDAQGESLDSCWGFYGSPWSSNPEKGNAWAVLDAARDALEALAPGQAQARAAQAQAARVAFLEGKAQARAAQAQGFEGSRLCAMVRAGLAAQAQEWRDATRDARAWAALVADLGGVSHGV